MPTPPTPSAAAHAVAVGRGGTAATRGAAHAAAAAAAAADTAAAGAAATRAAATGAASATSQPNATKNPAPQSNALENTLEKLRSLQKQTQPPKARYNPQAGGAPNGGGNPPSDDTSALSMSQRGAIGDYVRRCWSTDPGMLDLDKMQVLLTVTTDASGVVRRAMLRRRMRAGSAVIRGCGCSPSARVRAVLDPNCANLPLPQSMLGQTRDFTFLFRP